MGLIYTQPQGFAQIDRNNPLGAKVVYASTLAGVALDAATGKIGVNTAAVPKVTPRGRALNFNGSSAYITLPTTNLVSGYPLTVSCWFEKPPTASGVIYSLNGTGYSAIAGFFSDAGGNLIANANSSSGFTGYPHSSVPAGWNHLITVHRNGSHTFYLNGIDISASEIYCNRWGQPSAGNHSIGNRLNGASPQYFNGGIQDLTVFAGELSPTEILYHYQNKYQIFKSQSRRIFVASAGGASYNVVLDTSTYAITSIDTAIKADRKATLASTSYTVSDLNIAVKADRKATLASTSYTAPGLNIAVKADRKATLASTSYTAPGLNIAVKADRKATLASTSYIAPGLNIAVKADRKATLASTSYTVSDLNIAVKADRKATLASTSYNISSLPLELVYSSIVITGYSIVLNPNTYTASDLDIALKTTRKTTLASVNYSVSNVDTALKADRKTALSPVNYNITGLDNVFKASRGISLGTTSYSIVGFNSNYYTNRSVVLGPSIYITEGYPIVFPTYIPSYQPAHFIFSRPVAEVLTNVGVFGGVFEAQSRSTTISRPVAEVLTNVGVFGGVFEAQSRSTTISRPTENTQFLASSRDLIFIRN